MSFLDQIKSGAINGWHKYQVLPSLTAAQAVLESGWGSSTLSKPPYNNCFGIKASNDWTGRTVTMPTREVVNGRSIRVNAAFRAYDSIADSVEDHGAFFTSTAWRKNNYRNVVGEKDYKQACYAVKAAGYATDPAYATSLIRIIEQHKLYEWDQEAFSGKKEEPSHPEPELPSSDGKLVNNVKSTVGGQMSAEAKSAADYLDVSVIGDSLGVGTKPYLQELVKTINFDVYGSRQIVYPSDAKYDGTEALKQMKNSGQLKNYVVVILGTNRGVTESEVRNFASIAGDQRKVLFVDTASEVGHASSVSAIYKKVSSEVANIFHVNWMDYARPKLDSLYYADGANGAHIHMNARGYKLHAEYIVQALYEVSTFVRADIQVEKNKLGQIQKVGIAQIKLDLDGTIHYHLDEGHGPEVSRNIGIKGFKSDYGSNAVYCPMANQKWGLADGEQSKDWIEGKFEDSDEEDPVALLVKALNNFKNRMEPEAKYRCKLMDIPDDLSIGDTGTFVDHSFQPPLYIKARVIELTTSETNPSANTVMLGNVEEMLPIDNADIKALQAELEVTREKMLEGSYIATDFDATITASAGLSLSDSVPSTTLTVDLAGKGGPVNASWFEYEWVRVSEDKDADAEFNKLLVDWTGLVIEVKKEEIQGEQSSFMCQIKEPTGEIIKTVAAVVKIAQDGLSAYDLWLKAGNKGTMEDFLESLKGSDGANGVPGPPGKDGKSTYIHTAWADSPLGDNFSTDKAENRKYVGFVTTSTKEDPTDYSVYTWQYVKGKDGRDGTDGKAGRNGIDGKPGKDGKTGKIGQNLLRKSNIPTSTKEYLNGRWDLCETPQTGEVMTVTLKIKLDKNDRIAIYNSGGMINLSNFFSIEKTEEFKIVSTTFKWADKIVYQGKTYDQGNPPFLNLYIHSNGNGDNKRSNLASVEWITLTRGDIPSIEWTPCYADFSDEINEKANQIDITNVVQILSDTQRKVESLDTSLNVTKNNAVITHSAEYIQAIESLRGDANDASRQIKMLEEHKKIVDTNFAFDDDLTIGKSDSKNKMRLNNERLEFLDGETVAAHLSGNFFHAQNMRVTTSFEIGNHKFERNGENTSVRWIGGK